MSKNNLYAFCIKSGYELPNYHSISSGPSHNPSWISSVSIRTGPMSLKFDSQSQKTKKDAEQMAASIAMKFLEPPVSIIPALKIQRRTALIVDVENLPKFISQIPKYEGPMAIYAFIGKHHPLAAVDYDHHVEKILSPSHRKNGTDTCIQTWIGASLMHDEFEEYLIATYDHFGASLVDLIKSDQFSWYPRMAKVVTSVDHIIDEI